MSTAWGVQSSYDTISLFISQHKTTENLLKTGAFTVSFATLDTMAISDYLGIESGAKVPNKIVRLAYISLRPALANSTFAAETGALL